MLKSKFRRFAEICQENHTTNSSYITIRMYLYDLRAKADNLSSRFYEVIDNHKYFHKFQ